MKLLLDSQAFLWFIMGDARLSARAREAIEEPRNEKWISLASVWEIAIKLSLGKLTLSEPVETLLPREIHANGFRLLSIEFAHAVAVSKLPFHHRDPFDRLLIAQCVVDACSIVSADEVLDAYGIARIW